MSTLTALDSTPQLGAFRVLDEWTHRVSVGRAQLIEEHFRILLRPAPRWCPERWWLRLAAHFIILGEQRPWP